MGAILWHFFGDAQTPIHARTSRSFYPPLQVKHEKHAEKAKLGRAREGEYTDNGRCDDGYGGEWEQIHTHTHTHTRVISRRVSV